MTSPPPQKVLVVGVRVIEQTDLQIILAVGVRIEQGDDLTWAQLSFADFKYH